MASEELRLIAFPAIPAAALKRDFWQEAFGESPETSTRKKFFRIDEGHLGERLLTVSLDPNRITWSVLPSLDPENPPTGVPVLGDFLTVYGECSGFFQRFLTEFCPEAQRLAFHAVLLKPYDSREDCYRALGSLLPSVKIEPDTYDFNYRINRKRKARSVQEPLLVNRLSTWSAIQWRLHHLAIEGPSAQAVIPPIASFACKLDLDINTDTDFQGVLPPGSLKEIWDELVDLGVEIAAQGDIP